MDSKTLRASILQMALEGKLVPQQDDEPSVKQIGDVPDESPFVIPEKWKWIRLDNLFIFIDYRGKTPVKSNSGIRLITASNVKSGFIDHKRIEYISEEEYKNRQSRGISKKGDILFTTEAPLGHVALADLDEYSAGQRVITLRDKKGLILHSFAIYAMLSKYFQQALIANSTGTTAQGIKAARLKCLWLPIPSIEEQNRIVEKLDELLPIVDAYGKAEEELRSLDSVFPDKLRASVLQEAIQGKLVPQLDDEPGVEQIGEAPEDVPFVIPDKWKFVYMKEIIKLISGRDLPRNKIFETKGNVPYITGASQVENGRLIINRWANEKAVISKCGDLLITCKGTVGKIAKNEMGEINIARQLMAITVDESKLISNYLKCFLEFSVNELIRKSRSIIPGISRKDILYLIVPLPPIDEQHRIVDKVNELFAEIDNLNN